MPPETASWRPFSGGQINDPQGGDVVRGAGVLQWRCHPNPHGWMFGLHIARTGCSEPFEFNMVRVFLGAAGLDALEQTVIDERLPHTETFFFGESDPDQPEEDLDFIAQARALINDGWDVFHHSWW
nr:hypothetical protein [Stenotrophomonas maltophilia]